MKKEEEMNTTEIGIGGNREHKDTLFRKIFGTEEHKQYLLSLYNAVNHSKYKNIYRLIVKG